MNKVFLLTSLLGLSSLTQAGIDKVDRHEPKQPTLQLLSVEHLDSVSDEAKKALENAHRAFLQSKYRAMNDWLRKALMLSSNDPLFVNNASQLLEKAYEAKRDGRLPADIALPDGVTAVKVGEIYRERFEQKPQWRIRLGGDIKQQDFVQQIRIVRYPNEVIMDKNAGVGAFESDARNGGFYFNATSDLKPTPFQDGLYLFDIATADGQNKQGWFILSDLAVNTAPKVLAPKPHDALSTQQPMVRWEEYRSERLKNYDIRSISASISSVLDNGDWDDKWEFYTDDPSVTSSEVGVDPLGSGVTSLEPGKYIVKVNYREKHQFGPLRVRRESLTVVPFSVTP